MRRGQRMVLGRHENAQKRPLRPGEPSLTPEGLARVSARIAALSTAIDVLEGGGRSPAVGMVINAQSILQVWRAEGTADPRRDQALGHAIAALSNLRL